MIYAIHVHAPEESFSIPLLGQQILAKWVFDPGLAIYIQEQEELNQSQFGNGREPDDDATPDIRRDWPVSIVVTRQLPNPLFSVSHELVHPGPRPRIFLRERVDDIVQATEDVVQVKDAVHLGRVPAGIEKLEQLRLGEGRSRTQRCWAS